MRVGGGEERGGTVTTQHKLAMEDEEQQRLRNFLRYYDLGHYHQAFTNLGVTKLAYLKDVDDTDLDKIGLTRPEKARLKKKVESYFSKFGKLKV